MTRWIIYGLIAAIGGAALILLLAQDQGYVLISIGKLTIEMSFVFTVLLILGGLYLSFKSFQLYKIIRNSLAGSISWISESRDKRYEKRSQRGLIYFVEGNWRAAKKELLAAAKLNNKPLVHYLAAANCAFELNDEEETRFLLDLAEKAAPEHALAVYLMQARMDMRAGRFEKALAGLERSHKQFPQDPVVLKLLKDVHLNLQDWPSLLDVVAKMKNLKLLSKEETQKLEVQAWTGQLETALAKASELNDEPRASFEHIWKNLPTSVKKEADIVSLYTKVLAKYGFHERAMEVLIYALNENWNSVLLETYGELKLQDKKHQLLQAETWLRSHPGDEKLLFVLGKLARANELWGKARDYLQKSLKIKPSPAAYAELADLLAHLDEHKESVECFHKGLELANRVSS